MTREHTMSAAEYLHLTPTEGQMLQVLARNPGKLVSQRQLLRAVWGPSYLTETHYLAPVHETNCAASSSRTPPPHGTSSPSRAWATGSRPEFGPIHAAAC